MDCLKCKNKACKIEKKDCNGRRNEIIDIYKEKENRKKYALSDKLVANGLAGKLSRAEEIVKYASLNNYEHIAIAYCFCMEDTALKLHDYFLEYFKVTSYRCTINGITENQIVTELGDGVNCNPIGQALAINNDKSDLVVEMGLCIGHDILFNKYLKKESITFIVKDRVFNNNPQNFFKETADILSVDDFITNIDSSMGMKSSDWLEENQIKQNITVIDLRAESAFKNEHIPHSLNIPLVELPKRYSQYLKDKNRVVVCVCNGSVQSAYAIQFLYVKGFKNAYNLSGGFSSWKKQEKNVVASIDA